MKTWGKKNNLVEKVREVKERKIKRLVEKSKETAEKESDKKNLWKINLPRKRIIKRHNKNESVGEREMMMMMVIVVMVGETDNVVEKVKGIKEKNIEKRIEMIEEKIESRNYRKQWKAVIERVRDVKENRKRENEGEREREWFLKIYM